LQAGSTNLLLELTQHETVAGSASQVTTFWRYTYTVIIIVVIIIIIF